MVTSPIIIHALRAAFIALYFRFLHIIFGQLAEVLQTPNTCHNAMRTSTPSIHLPLDHIPL